MQVLKQQTLYKNEMYKTRRVLIRVQVPHSASLAYLSVFIIAKVSLYSEYGITMVIYLKMLI